MHTALLERSRQDAIERMVRKAEALGANAVLSMRFDASQLSSYMTEVVAYGTAAPSVGLQVRAPPSDDTTVLRFLLSFLAPLPRRRVAVLHGPRHAG